MPKPGGKDIYKRLQTQCTNMSISLLPNEDPIASLSTSLQSTDVILDAIFGFSFKPPVRAPFDAVLPLIAHCGKPIVSVDIPSGWDVEKGKISVATKEVSSAGQVRGDTEFEGLEPDVLISLTAPKLGVKQFTGRHFLGGRFVSKCVSFTHCHYLSDGDYNRLTLKQGDGKEIRAQSSVLSWLRADRGITSVHHQFSLIMLQDQTQARMKRDSKFAKKEIDVPISSSNTLTQMSHLYQGTSVITGFIEASIVETMIGQRRSSLA